MLARHAVDYVLIGGLAAVLHGSALVTNDADICPNRDPENLARLADALRELDARVRTPSEPGGVAFACDAEFLARMQMLNLDTTAGQFDIAFAPAGFAGYDELVEQAIPYDIDGVARAGRRAARHHPEQADREPAQGPGRAPAPVRPRRRDRRARHRAAAELEQGRNYFRRSTARCSWALFMLDRPGTFMRFASS